MMESHPLNLAHQQYRRADAHTKNQRFDEAMQCHQNAAELLLDAMKTTKSTVALESISLQHSYHLKQKDIVKVKKEKFARVKKAMENIKCLSLDPNINPLDTDHKLQIAIYKTLNESDNLLHVLTKNSTPHVEPSTLSNHSENIPNSKDDDSLNGKKKVKTQTMVVEELQVLSQNLHSLVEQLVLQVEVLKDDNITLNDKVSYLEKERHKYLNISTQGNLDYSCDLPGISTFVDSYVQESSNQINTSAFEKYTVKNVK